METVEQIVVMPSIGDKAPDFNATTNQGEIWFFCTKPLPIEKTKTN